MEQEQHQPIQAYKTGDIIGYKARYLFTDYCVLLDGKSEITSYLHDIYRHRYTYSTQGVAIL